MQAKDVAQIFDISVPTLHYYEKIGVIPPVTKNSSGYRDYSDRDLNWIHLAVSFKRAGLSLHSMVRYVE